MESKNNYFNSVDLLELLDRWKWHLVIVAVIAFAGSVIFSSPVFIKPKYKSEGIIYPSNLIAYSDESPTEQMLQIIQSTDIRRRMIDAFDLYKHYEIDTVSDKFHLTHVNELYDENVSIKKTEYESMEITVFDADPIIASQMVDSLIHFFNRKARKMQSEKSEEVMIIIKNQMDEKKNEMDSLEAILQNLAANYGLFEFKSQAREASKVYLKNPGKKEVSDLYRALRDKGQYFNSITEHLWRVRGTYNDLKIQYENAKRDVVKNLTYANVVTRPFPADKKSYPVRWLISLVVVSASVLLAFMVLLMMDARKKISSR